MPRWLNRACMPMRKLLVAVDEVQRTGLRPMRGLCTPARVGAMTCSRRVSRAEP